MLHQGDFYMVSSFSDRLSLIDMFIESEEWFTLLIIVDMNAIQDTIQSIKRFSEVNSVPCRIIINDIIVHDDENFKDSDKTIYIHQALDAYAKNVIRSRWAQIAFFE